MPTEIAPATDTSPPAAAPEGPEVVEILVFADDRPDGVELAAALARTDRAAVPRRVRVVDVWADPALAVAHRIVTIPTAIVLVAGTEHARVSGRSDRAARRVVRALAAVAAGDPGDPHRIPHRSPRPPRRRSVR